MYPYMKKIVYTSILALVFIPSSVFAVTSITPTDIYEGDTVTYSCDIPTCDSFFVFRVSDNSYWGYMPANVSGNWGNYPYPSNTSDAPVSLYFLAMDGSNPSWNNCVNADRLTCESQTAYLGVTLQAQWLKTRSSTTLANTFIANTIDLIESFVTSNLFDLVMLAIGIAFILWTYKTLKRYIR